MRIIHGKSGLLKEWQKISFRLTPKPPQGRVAAMRRDVFPFVIGYEGQTALVDRQLYRTYRNASVERLLKARLFKAALARALYDGDQAGLEAVLRAYNAQTPHPIPTVEALKRAFGLPVVPEGVTRYLFL